MKFNSLKLSFSVLLLVILLAIAFFYAFSRSDLLSKQQASVVVKIPHGASAMMIGRILAKKTDMHSAHLWKWYTRLTGNMHRLQAGEYLIVPGMQVTTFLDKMVEGAVLIHHVTFVPGWTFKQVKQWLVKQPSLKDDLQGLSNAQIMKKLRAKKTKPEGLFFPDTYDYVWGDSDLNVLKVAYLRMQLILQQSWAARAKHLRYRNSYQALIVASMIEKETALESERPMVAGVILRRLKKHMRLQIDPTVVYGLGLPYGTKLTYKNLRSKTLYNTYVHYGLPPTPICLPSLASIQAALHPDHSSYLYYVSKGDGSHIFSNTYLQQVKNVKKYILKS